MPENEFVNQGKDPDKVKDVTIKVRAVYHYRNRWAVGAIEFIVDLETASVMQVGKKHGFYAIKDRAMVERLKRKDLDQFIPLVEFLKIKCGGKIETLTELAEMILEAGELKKMWVHQSYSDVIIN